MKKSLSLLLALIMLLTLALPAAAAEAPVTINTTAEAANISKFGNVRLALTCDEIKAAGYVYGDVVTVEFLDKSMDLPFCSYYSDVDSGTTGLFALEEETQVYAAINMGNFAATYGIADKTTNDDGTYVWDYREGITGPVTFTISLKEAGGYYEEYVMHQLSYTNERADYPQLSDAQFANFRAVTTSGMGENILYRTATPVNPEKGRNSYADAAIRAAGVTVVMNLSDNETNVMAFPGFEESYYATKDYIALNMDMDFTTAAFASQLADGLRFFADNPGVYAVHCLEGKDRTGFVIALLECWMGAGYDEIIADYMTTYYNYYGVTEDDPRYATIANGNIVKILRSAFDVSDLQSADLAAEATEYMKSLGLTEAELTALKTNLSVSRPVAADSDAATRGDAVSALWGMAGQPVVNYLMRFSDVPGDAWYAEAVRWAASEEIVKGYDTGTFGPNEPISRQELAVMLYRYARKQGLGFTGAWMFPLNYADAGEIADWANEAMHWVVMNLIMEGRDGKIEPTVTVPYDELEHMIAAFGRTVGADLDIAGKIIGRWMIADLDGQPVTTNEKGVFTFPSPTKASISASFSSRPELGTAWIEQIEADVAIEGSKVTLTWPLNENATQVEELSVFLLTDDECSGDLIVKQVKNGAETIIDEETIRLVRVNNDLSDDILGTWEGRCTSAGSAFDDGQVHRWEYRPDGTYVYYENDGDNWLPGDDTMNEYFVAGNLLCTRWAEGDTEYREWWEITIDGETMNWTALRRNDDGSPFFVTFEMTKVDAPSGNGGHADGYRGIDVASPDWVGMLDAAKDAKQMLIVAGFREDATDAWISLHEKQSDGSWHMVMTTPGFIGKNGLGKTREGDAKTPVGVFHFNRAFGIADDPGCAIPYVKVDEDTYWSGDPREGYHYNELVSLKDLPGLDLESGDSEHIIDYPYHYQYCLNISYNEEGTPGEGSAIFLHCFGPAKPFTGGCVAIPEDHMRYVMQIVDGSTAVVIDTYEALSGGADWPGSTWPQER